MPEIAWSASSSLPVFARSTIRRSGRSLPSSASACSRNASASAGLPASAGEISEPLVDLAAARPDRGAPPELALGLGELLLPLERARELERRGERRRVAHGEQPLQLEGAGDVAAGPRVLGEPPERAGAGLKLRDELVGERDRVALAGEVVAQARRLAEPRLELERGLRRLVRLGLDLERELDLRLLQQHREADVAAPPPPPAPPLALRAWRTSSAASTARPSSTAIAERSSSARTSPLSFAVAASRSRVARPRATFEGTVRSPSATSARSSLTAGLCTSFASSSTSAFAPSRSRPIPSSIARYRASAPPASSSSAATRSFASGKERSVRSSPTPPFQRCGAPAAAWNVTPDRSPSARISERVSPPPLSWRESFTSSRWRPRESEIPCAPTVDIVRSIVRRWSTSCPSSQTLCGAVETVRSTWVPLSGTSTSAARR